MTAPLLWIFLPGLWALLLLAMPGRLRYISGIAAGLALAALAWKTAIAQVIAFGGLQIKIAPGFSLLGRVFLLGDATRPLLLGSYLLLTAWLIGGWLSNQDNRFPAFALGLQAIWIGAWAIRPFLYAVLLIAAAALLTTLFFSLFRASVSNGVMRLLILQTLAVPALLIASWLLEGVTTAPSENAVILSALVLLGCGFALLLPAFPFHIWLGQLAEEIPPYLLAFWLAIFPTNVLIFFLGLFEQFAWLREDPAWMSWLTLLGFVTLGFASIQAAWQKDAARLLAWAGLATNGILLLAIGHKAIDAALLLILPRHFALLATGFGLAQITMTTAGSSLRRLQGVAYRQSLALTLTTAGLFTLSGLPLFTAFSPYLAIWEKLLESHIAEGAVFGLGLAGLAIGALRLLAVSLLAEKPAWQMPGNFAALLWNLTLLGLLVFPGLYPAWLQTLSENLLKIFAHLAG